MKVLLMPNPSLPYFSVLIRQLTEKGIQVWTAWKFPRRGILFGEKYDVVHLHQLDPLFRTSLTKFLWFLLVLWPVMKLRGIRLIWTCHEPTPHVGSDELRWCVRLWTSVIVRIADNVIVHSRENEQKIQVLFGDAVEPKMVYVSHGSLEDYYAEVQGEKPGELNVDLSKPLFVSVGYMRPNKGNDVIVRAFKEVSDRGAQLVVIGNCEVDDYFRSLEELCCDDSRVTLLRKDLSTEEIVWLHRNATAAVFAFTDCPTTGSVITAMSLGACVVGPAVGHCEELLRDNAGVLYIPNNRDGALTHCLQSLCSDSLSATTFGNEALRQINRPSWKEIVDQMLCVYSPRRV